MRYAGYRLFALGLATCIALAACTPPPAKFKATDLSAVDWGGDFELTAHTGKRVSTAEYRGKVLVLFFGYTHCPDICAPTLTRLAEVMKQLGADAARVQVLFVTVDPRHDTASQLAGFVPRFDPSFVGMTGSEAEIAAVAKDYKVAFQTNSQSTAELAPGASMPRSPRLDSIGERALVDHFGGLMVKDATGKLRLTVKNDAVVDDIAHDLRLLLKQKA
jgi:protein SCO1/2